METTTDRSALEGKLIPELQRIAQEMGIEGTQKLRKAGLIDAIVEKGGNGEANASTGSAAPRGRRGANGESAASAEGAEAPPETSTEERADERGTSERADDTSEAEERGAEDGDVDGNREAPRAPRGDRQRDDRGDRGRDRNQDRGPSDRGDRNQDRNQPRNQGGQPRNQDRAQGGQDQDQGGQRDRDGRRQRPSREERRRQREERRLREEADRAEEVANAPTQTGILDLLPEGYGFLRTSGYLPGSEDVYVSLSQVRRRPLRKGDVIGGKVRRPRDNEKYFALLEVETVNGMDPETARERPNFDKLTPLFPDERFRLEIGPARRDRADHRHGRADRQGPARHGRLAAQGGQDDDPQADRERDHRLEPGDARDRAARRRAARGGHRLAAHGDRPPRSSTRRSTSRPNQHIQVTELVLERAKRLAEIGQDVVIILDSITRLARAYNLAMPASGKILSGGIDSTALYPPRRFFGAARNIEEGGSLTIIASALVETGSRMDEGIFEEFKGTGNMELRLDRQLAEKRLFPAINVDASGTRKEELLHAARGARPRVGACAGSCTRWSRAPRSSCSPTRSAPRSRTSSS